MAKPEPPINKEKKPYSPPELIIHGTIEELTQKTGGHGGPDGGNPLFQPVRTHL